MKKSLLMSVLGIGAGAIAYADLRWELLPSTVNWYEGYRVEAKADGWGVTIFIMKGGSYLTHGQGDPWWNDETGTMEDFAVGADTSDTAGPVYYSAWTYSHGGSIEGTVEVLQPPLIGRQPASRSLSIGTSVRFEALFYGAEPMTYQWKKNGTNVAGATTTTLALTNLQTSASGNYTLTATNADGTADSNPAVLVVNPLAAPAIVSQPSTATHNLSAPTAPWNSPLAAGFWHSLILRHDGTVGAVGSNSYGQLGDGTTTNRVTPITVSGLTSVVAIAASNGFSVALRTDGTVWVWGWTPLGMQVLTPTQVAGMSGVVAVATGTNHLLFLKGDGTVWAVGANYYGQIGDGTTVTRSTPVQVTGLSNVVRISAAWGHSVAVKSDGTVWTWGSNQFGQLGRTGTTTVPGQVSELQGLTVQSVTAGQLTTFAILDNQSIRAWGYGAGDGTSLVRPTPVALQIPTGATAIAASAWAGMNTYVIRSDSSIWELIPTPAVSRFPLGVAVASCFDHSIGLKSDGTVWTWGGNQYGQLGDGSLIDRTNPIQLSNFVGRLPAASTAFTVAYTGSPEPSFQWQRKPSGQSTFSNLSNDTTYAGVNASTLMVRNLVLGMNGDEFRCVVSNSQGSVTSNAALLSLVSAPTITTPPQPTVANQGANVTLNVVATGTAPLAYVWKKNGTTIAGATTSSLALANVQAADGGNYSVVVSNAQGSATSASAVVFVDVPPTPVPFLNYLQVTAKSATLTWNPARDDVGIASYKVYRGGAEVGTTGELVYFDSGLLPNTTYLYSVVAVDTSGKTSTGNPTLNVTTTQDFTADTDQDGVPNAIETAVGTTAIARPDTGNVTTSNIHRPVK